MSVDQAPPVRVLIADDHSILRTGLRRLLEVEPKFVVVGEAADGAETVRLARHCRPDIVLLDLAMPGGSGLDVLAEIGHWEDVRVILLTAAIEKSQIDQALRLGARGIMLKGTITAFLFESIRSVMAGHYWLENKAAPMPLAARGKRKRSTK